MMQQINLYQPIFRKEKKVFSAQAMVEVTVIVLLLLIVVYGVGMWNTSRLESGVSSMETTIKQHLANLEKLKKEFPQKAKDKLLATRITQLQQAVTQKRKIIEALAGGGIHGNKTGFSRLLTGFARLHMTGVWLQQLDIGQGGAHLNIAGKAISPDIVPEYIQGLSKDPAFRGRRFEVFKLTGASKEDSSIRFVLNSSKTGKQ